MFASSPTLPASLVHDRVAARPAGGKRRSVDGGRRYQRGSVTGGRRSRSDTDSLLVNAADAARVIGSMQSVWDPQQILAHPEVTMLAARAVRAELDADDLSTRRLGRLAPSHRRRRNLALAELELALEALAELHGLDLVVGD